MNKYIFYATVIITLLCLAGGIYLLVLSIKGTGNYVLAGALGLIALGNFLIGYANFKRKK